MKYILPLCLDITAGCMIILGDSNWYILIAIHMIILSHDIREH